MKKNVHPLKENQSIFFFASKKRVTVNMHPRHGNLGGSISTICGMTLSSLPDKIQAQTPPYPPG